MPHPIELLTVMSRGEVAEALGVHLNTVYDAERRAFKKIREQYPWLAEYLIEEPCDEQQT